MTPACAMLVICLLGIIVCLLLLQRKDTVTDFSDAIKMLLTNGFIVERNRHHLYQSKPGGEYILLLFNLNATMVGEEVFDRDGLDQAVARFLELSEEKA